MFFIANSFTAANRLNQLSDGLSTVEYRYNGDGVRVAQIADGIRTDYVQDVSLPLPQLLTAEQGGTINRYLRGLGLIGEQQQGTAWQYHLPDALGSVRQLTDPQGHVVLAQHFDPFGAPTIVNRKSEIVNRYGFAGEEQDAGGHIFLRARTYNPETGRFLQSDPVLGTPDQPRTLHHYAYAFNNPVNYTDPAGLMPPQTGAGGGFQGQRVYPPSHSYNAATPKTQRGAGGNYTRQTTVTARRMNALSAGGPARSANSGIPIVSVTAHNNYTRAQSEGQRPQNCNVGGGSSNPLDVLFGLRDAARGLGQLGQTIAKELAADLKNQDPAAMMCNGVFSWSCPGFSLPNSPTLNRTLRQVGRFLMENPDLVVGLVPVVGDVYDGISGALGEDLLTGRRLSNTDKTLSLVGAAVGFFTVGDEVANAFKLLSRAADKMNIFKAAKAAKGVSRFDKVVDTSRVIKNSVLRRLPKLEGLKGFGRKVGGFFGGGGKKISTPTMPSTLPLHRVQPEAMLALDKRASNVSLATHEAWIRQNLARDNLEAIARRFDIDLEEEWVATTGLLDDIQGFGKNLEEWKRPLGKNVEMPPTDELMAALRPFLSEDIPIIAVRSLPAGSAKYHGRLLHKPEGAKLLGKNLGDKFELKGPNGIRIIVDNKGKLGRKGQLQLVVSDLDVGVVIKKDGTVMTNKEFIKTFIRPRDGSESFNDIFARILGRNPDAKMIDHGHQVWGQAWVDGVPGYASLEDVYVFRYDKEGYTVEYLPSLVLKEGSLLKDKNIRRFYQKILPDLVKKHAKDLVRLK